MENEKEKLSSQYTDTPETDMTSAPVQDEMQETAAQKEVQPEAAAVDEDALARAEAAARAMRERRERETARSQEPDTSSFAYVRDHAPLHGEDARVTESPWTRSETVQTEAPESGAPDTETPDAEMPSAETEPETEPTQTVAAVSRYHRENSRGGKPKGPRKLLATVLIAALCGGAVGGLTGYAAGTQSGGSKSVGRYSAVTPQTTSSKSSSASDSGNMSITDIAAKAMPAVVGVYNVGNQVSFFGSNSGGRGTENAQGYGSGVLISEDGTIVTNYHVVEGASRVVVATSDGKQYDAQVMGTDAALDLAVLKINGSGFQYVDIADSDSVKVGDEVVAIGNPLGDEFSQTVTDGIISGVDRKVSSEDGDLGLFQTNAAINSGNSGGALLNGQAQLIGINSMKVATSGVEGMGFAIPSNVVLDFVNNVADGKTSTSTKKAWLGIQGYSMDQSLAQRVGTEQTTGILIANVTSGGPAAEGGLEAGDVIVAVDDTKVTGFDDLTKYLAKKAPGDQITLEIVRSGQKGSAEITLGQQN